MQMPGFLQEESLLRLIQGAVIGTLATVIVGFGWGGWMLGGSAKLAADTAASSAVIAAMAPICVEQFQRSPDASANLTALKAVGSWQQSGLIDKGQWAVMPGSKTAETGVSQACASLLTAPKQ